MTDKETFIRRARERRVEEKLKLIFPQTKDSHELHGSLVPFQTESRSSTWIYHLDGQAGIKKKFVKANEAGSNPYKFRAQREKAGIVNQLHSFCCPSHFGIYTILSVEDRQIARKEDMRLQRAGIIRNPELSPTTIVLEITEFIDGLTFGGILERDRLKSKFDAKSKVAWRRLVETFHRVHRTPTDKELNLSGTEEDKIEARKDIYNSKLYWLQEQAYQHLPLNRTHTFLSENDLQRFVVLGFGLRNMRKDSWQRLRHTHGDAQARNCIQHAKTGKIYLFDWGRQNLSDYAMDWGRFIADILWRYEMDPNEHKTDYPLQVVEYLIETCTKMYKDPEFRKAIDLGIYSLTTLRLRNKELKGLDLGRVQNYVERVFNLLEKNVCSVTCTM